MVALLDETSQVLLITYPLIDAKAANERSFSEDNMDTKDCKEFSG
jgi:hypothetical protein